MNQVPKQISEQILAKVKNRLNPDLKKLLAKVLAINLVTALLTLLVCPQLGQSYIATKVNLMDVFMKVSPWFCDFACGVFFTSTSVLSLYLFLSRDEMGLLRYKKMLTLITITFSSLGMLIMLNPRVFVAISALWLLGLTLGCLGSLQLGSLILKKL